jgi:hypothetical protein
MFASTRDQIAFGFYPACKIAKVSGRAYYPTSMMIKYLGVIVAVVFAVLALIHVYWAVGGSFGSSAGVPTIDGKRTFEPTATATLLVAAALFAAMLVILGQIGFWGNFIPQTVFRMMTLIISLVFLMRAIGDFSSVGFFKQIKDTPFAYWDTRLYSPLCLFITIAAFLVSFSEEN